MILSLEDAYFYKILFQCGYEQEVYEWIDAIAYENEELVGIYLDLVWCGKDINKIISCLHNYIGDKEINDKEVCDKLRMFISEKLNNNKIDINKAADSLSSFVSPEKLHDKYWSDFYMISVYGDFISEGLMDIAEYNTFVRKFLETGKLISYDAFLASRSKGFNDERKKERKYKILCTLALIVYSVLIMGLCILIIEKIKNVNGDVGDKVLAITVVSLCLFIVPPIVICVVGWDMVYSFLTREKKYVRKRIKEERIRVEKERKRDSDEQRKKYKLNDSILTAYEYSNLEYGSYRSKIKWAIFIITELIALGMTVGTVFYYDYIGIELCIAFMFFGLGLAIYGFCILLRVLLKGLFYSFTPVICYAIPLIVVYYGLNVEKEWIIGLSTIMVGSILFFVFLLFVVIIPFKKYNKVSNEYDNYLKEKYKKIKYPYECTRDDKLIMFWKKNGCHVMVFEYKVNKSIIILKGNIKFNKCLLKDVIIEYYEEKDSFENAIFKGIDLLSRK